MKLWVVDIGSVGGIVGHMVKVLTPIDLCRNRGIDVGSLGEDCIFVDDLLGYAVVDAKAIGILKDDPRSRNLHFEKNVYIQMDKDWKNTSYEPKDWYLLEMAGWPEGTGKGQRIAVLDDGIISGCVALPRACDHRDFCSSGQTGAPTGNLGEHGTCCAGVIGAKGQKRRSVGPDCELIVCQLVPRGGAGSTTLVDVLLMMSWAIHRWKVRVINISFGAPIRQPGIDMFSVVAKRLRVLDLALVFCAVGEISHSPAYPAKAGGAIPVAGYEQSDKAEDGASPGIQAFNMTNPEVWAKYGDLFFAPCNSLSTIGPDGNNLDYFGETSGACAFVAGVAALYMESYPFSRVEEILALMKKEAKMFLSPSLSGLYCRAISFPVRRPAGRLKRLLGQWWRRLRSAFSNALVPLL
jgi:subtilisin family serine protease